MIKKKTRKAVPSVLVSLVTLHTKFGAASPHANHKSNNTTCK